MSAFLSGPHLPSQYIGYPGFPIDHPTVAVTPEWFTDWFREGFYTKLSRLGAYDIDKEYTPPSPYRRNYV